MEDKRKPFNIKDFVNNEDTPVETKKGNRVYIHTTKRLNDKFNFYQIIGEVQFGDKSWGLYWWSEEGQFEETEKSNHDLVFSLKKFTRRMTNYELATWLNEKSDEHREWKRTCDINIRSYYSYIEGEQDIECDKDILIRSNKGEWYKPLIEEQ